jgi:hypothetical protein
MKVLRVINTVLKLPGNLKNPLILVTMPYLSLVISFFCYSIEKRHAFETADLSKYHLPGMIPSTTTPKNKYTTNSHPQKTKQMLGINIGRSVDEIERNQQWSLRQISIPHFKELETKNYLLRSDMPIKEMRITAYYLEIFASTIQRMLPERKPCTKYKVTYYRKKSQFKTMANKQSLTPSSGVFFDFATGEISATKRNKRNDFLAELFRNAAFQYIYLNQINLPETLKKCILEYYAQAVLHPDGFLVCQEIRNCFTTIKSTIAKGEFIPLYLLMKSDTDYLYKKFPELMRTEIFSFLDFALRRTDVSILDTLGSINDKPDTRRVRRLEKEWLKYVANCAEK